jgi:hypothetical protein
MRSERKLHMSEVDEKMALFETGDLAASPGAIQALVHELVARHVRGDWGDRDEEDRQENEFSVPRHLRILSAYVLPTTGVRVWVITEADRSVTTVLLPEEY